MPYQVKPLELTPEKAYLILNNLSQHDHLFNDFQRGCPDNCGNCVECIRRRTIIARNLTAVNAMVWEAWKLPETDENGEKVWENEELVGILNLTDIVPGHDAVAHFVFWDGKLAGRANIINKWAEDCIFNGKLGLHRVTIEVPAWMEKLGHFLERKLGCQLEGTKREAVLKDGKWHDMLIYGRLA